jgi:hypothetical protein
VLLDEATSRQIVAQRNDSPGHRAKMYTVDLGLTIASPIPCHHLGVWVDCLEMLSYNAVEFKMRATFLQQPRSS